MLAAANIILFLNFVLPENALLGLLCWFELLLDSLIFICSVGTEGYKKGENQDLLVLDIYKLSKPQPNHNLT